MSEPDTATDARLPTGVTVAIGATADRSLPFASALADRLSLSLSTVHVEAPTAVDDTETSEEALARDIAGSVTATDLLVVESDNADPWRSRHSVTEHLIDAFPGTTIGLGPEAVNHISDGPILVALDGSPSAEGAVSTADALAEQLGSDLLLVRVVADDLHGDERNDIADASAYLQTLTTTIDAQAATEVGVSNDPVQAIAALATDAGASLIALASRGDRQRSRASMSRTAAGLIGRARCPVIVVADPAG